MCSPRSRCRSWDWGWRSRCRAGGRCSRRCRSTTFFPRRGGCSPPGWPWSSSPGSTIPAWPRRLPPPVGGLRAREITGSARETRLHRRLAAWLVPAALGLSIARGLAAHEDGLVVPGEPGRRGGRLVASLRSDPKTFNPLLARDSASRTVIDLLMADLVHIDRSTHLTRPSVAKSWEVSEDGRRYTLELRRGLTFSDGHPFDADDVLFSFAVY